MDANAAVLATLVAYKLVLIGVGVWAARLNRTETDFYLGGRAMGPWVAGLSYAASTSSAWVLLGVSAATPPGNAKHYDKIATGAGYPWGQGPLLLACLSRMRSRRKPA
jgi:Na+(H+)/acetate symporter ActP